MKYLTIIIPMYNMEKYIEFCLNSLVGISKDVSPLLEVFVVNDGSKDGSLQIALNYEKQYPTIIQVIDKENGNYGSCINAGLNLATGKYVKILDADDSFSSIGLNKTLVKLKNNEDADLVITNYDVVNEKHEITKKQRFNLPIDVLLSVDDVAKDIADLQMHAIIYKTEILKNMGYHQTEGISYTDQEWCYYPMTQVNSVKYYNITVYKYLLGRVGQTMSPSALIKMIGHLKIVALKMLEHFSSLHSEEMSVQRYRLLRKRVLVRLKDIYRLYLVEFGSNDFNVNDVLELDDVVKKQSIVIFRLLGLTSIYKKYIPIPYVILFRIFHIRFHF